MADMSTLTVPLALAELLHATLGPLSADLTAEGHPWADTLQRVLDAYVDERADHYGPNDEAEVFVTTMAAALRVESFTVGETGNDL